MADTQELDLNTLHQSIIDALAAQFPDIVTVDDYREDERQKVSVPAILVELAEMSPADIDPGTDQQSMVCRFEARVIMGFKTLNAKREIRKLCGALCAFVRSQRWGMGVYGVQPAEVSGAFPDNFEPELDQYEVWRVEWDQEVHFGTNVWTPEPGALTPTTVYLGYDPEIGPPNEPDYVQVVPNE